MRWPVRWAALILALVFSDAPASAHGSSPQNGACFELADRAASLCVPVRMTLIEVEANDGFIWADLDDDFLNVRIEMWSDTGVRSPRPDSFAAALPMSQMASRHLYKTEPNRWAFSQSGTCTVLEVEIADSEYTEFISEISCPAGILLIFVGVRSPKIENGEVDFVRKVKEIRLLTNTRDDTLELLHPYDEMERSDVQ